MEQENPALSGGGDPWMLGDAEVLRQLPASEWLAATDRWLIELRGTFGDAPNLKERREAARRLANLSNSLRIAADEETYRQAMWEFALQLRVFARSGTAEDLDLARPLILKTSSFVDSLRARVVGTLSETPDPQAPTPQVRIEPPGKQPLTQVQRLVFETLEGVAPNQGLIGKELVEELSRRGRPCSLASIKKAVARLRQAGYPVENKPGLGYFLRR